MTSFVKDSSVLAKESARFRVQMATVRNIFSPTLNKERECQKRQKKSSTRFRRKPPSRARAGGAGRGETFFGSFWLFAKSG
jgi:hypothetical protein